MKRRTSARAGLFGPISGAISGASVLGLLAAASEARAASAAAGASFGQMFAVIAGLLSPLALTVAIAIGIARVVFVPPRFAADSILEAEDAGIGLIVCITEGIPAHDELRVYNHLAKNPNVRLVGPNCPGILSPGKANVGIIPASFFKEGNVGVVSRSGTFLRDGDMGRPVFAAKAKVSEARR